jgi:hypothetical protein
MSNLYSLRNKLALIAMKMREFDAKLILHDFGDKGVYFTKKRK